MILLIQVIVFFLLIANSVYIYRHSKWLSGFSAGIALPTVTNAIIEVLK